MATVYFAPNRAIKYIGSRVKEFHTSLARPKPKLKRGDIVIVDKKTAFNLVHKGFGEFETVDNIEFVKADVKNSERLKILNAENSELVTANDKLNKENDKLNNEIIRLNELINNAPAVVKNPTDEMINKSFPISADDSDNDIKVPEAGTDNIDNEDLEVPELSTFDSKDALEEFGRTKGVELDKRKTLESMYDTLILELGIK